MYGKSGGSGTESPGSRTALIYKSTSSGNLGSSSPIHTVEGGRGGGTLRFFSLVVWGWKTLPLSFMAVTQTVSPRAMVFLGPLSISLVL